MSKRNKRSVERHEIRERGEIRGRVRGIVEQHDLWYDGSNDERSMIKLGCKCNTEGMVDCASNMSRTEYTDDGLERLYTALKKAAND